MFKQNLEETGENEKKRQTKNKCKNWTPKVFNESMKKSWKEHINVYSRNSTILPVAIQFSVENKPNAK